MVYPMWDENELVGDTPLFQEKVKTRWEANTLEYKD